MEEVGIDFSTTIQNIIIKVNNGCWGVGCYWNLDWWVIDGEICLESELFKILETESG